MPKKARNLASLKSNPDFQ